MERGLRSKLNPYDDAMNGCKIELVNGNTIEIIESNNVVRSKRAEFYKLWNRARSGETLTKEENELLESFMNIEQNVEWNKEYETIWVSSNDDK